MTPEQTERLEQIRRFYESGQTSDVDVMSLLDMVEDIDDQLLTMTGCWELVMKDRAKADAENAKLREALEAVLLFHSASPWDEQKATKWNALTGGEWQEATTRVLCDVARAALSSGGAP